VSQLSCRSTEAALEQHTVAADAFARTAQDVQDAEALRMLNLLEQEHRRLGQLVQRQRRPRLRAGASLDDSSYDLEASTTGPNVSKIVTINPSPRSTLSSDVPYQAAPTLERRQARPLSSSIANNLASARGIPTAPQRQMRPIHPEDRSSSRASGESKNAVKSKASYGLSQPAAQTTASLTQLQEHHDLREEDSFQRFYSGFEGLWSKLSAPLAFAGLPLVADAQAEHGTDQPDANESLHHHRHQSLELPDIDSIYSKAAIRAIREDRGPVGNAQESFYVVPDHSQISGPHNGKHDEDDLSEDARYSPQTGSLRMSRHVRNTTQPRISGKTHEELEVENASLKTLTDNLSKRLYMWEKNAQNQTAAMQQSIRSLQPPHTLSSPKLVQPHNDEKQQQLEDQLRTLQKEVDQQHRENAKLKTVVLRYRERWDKLKEGARVRREGTERAADEKASG
jgi:hypothetical protein